MGQKREVNRVWLYIFAIAVLILFIVLFFGDKIAFSPKISGDKSVSASDTNADEIIDIFGLDKRIDRRAQRVADAFMSAVEGAGR